MVKQECLGHESASRGLVSAAQAHVSHVCGGHTSARALALDSAARAGGARRPGAWHRLAIGRRMQMRRAACASAITAAAIADRPLFSTQKLANSPELVCREHARAKTKECA
ncbi:unnamed protein product [Chrysodeixis includens]|uniref:Uncharacterized protein n=1 Tax=Chrysodeixis includens TaxID=689277 RepID=A0A9N8L250_CHRIL|nr:unnamed protein product [Chrysodeixis includens]